MRGARSSTQATPPARRKAPPARRQDDHRRPEEAVAGDWIEVDGTRGSSPRRGVILEVLGSGPHEHFRVRWDEQHESLFYPAERGFAIHAAAGRRGR
jgi:Domain of unknown function (DUF1918)